ncbi:UbiD family decarboxylase [Geobacter pickeringii]|uniref:3-octaprenyl-4-hydroxybenzoate carboxy-lyase n=1 Tax=Geobacter pickeringii TaxID=345632 RepID=A0A0B5BH16_9BACT|nr:UbiD family decarboxylase [Geobacter pickeringii]AJE03795.1 3-octaprenyl-4-hydroxybenzoate carboxy-lyase [Geobacter pickeringii]
MGYRNLQECVADLERRRELIRIETEVDPNLEIGAVQRRVYQAGGPALLFTRVKGCRFPMLGNLFGTLDRTRYIFRDALDDIRHLVELKINPVAALRNPLEYLGVPRAALHLLPKKVSRGPVLASRTTIDQLPQLKSWPMDGGPFVTLPQVYSESPLRPGFRHSNLGMYRVQLGGNDYRLNEEVGIHYQIHRGIGVHHAEAIGRGMPFRVSVFVGGPPALTVAAVMPLPEGLPELSFAGLLGGRRLEMVAPQGQLPMPAEADFVITGTIDPAKTLPEGPFGDHLGYYSLVHDFPVLRVESVWHRPDAIWPFTTVGRPPQEDTTFGAFIHELTGLLIPEVLPGVKAVHAVDAAGVHPLLLAIGSERYVPYAESRQPRELLTIANAILGNGQLSLAKYLFISPHEDNPPDIHHVDAFLRFMLERVDWRRDLHFQTRTTIDTLDYSGSGLNEGSKVVIAAAGEKRRELPAELPAGLRLPEGFSTPCVCLPGVLAVQGGAFAESRDLNRFCSFFAPDDPINRFPLIVICDDSDFTARTLNNFLWVTFTRSNPATDISGIGEQTRAKHWGCEGSLVIDARIKPHHAPPLVDVPEIERRVDALGAAGGALHGVI